MAYTAPTTRSTSDLITASIWNTDLVDNITYLNARPNDLYTLNQVSDYTTTSTSFVDIDGTNLSLSIATNGGDVVVGFMGSAANANSGAGVYFNIDIDNGTAFAADDGMFLFTAPGASFAVNVSFSVIITGLSAGVHTFDLQWKVSSGTGKIWAGAGTSTLDLHPRFWVKEI